MSQKHKKDGLVTIIVTSNSKSRINNFMSKHGVKFPVAHRGGGAYGVRGIPHAYLLNHKGKVVWQGNPGGGRWDSHAKKALAAAPKGIDLSDGNYPSSFRSLLYLIKEAKYKRALRKLKRHLKSSKAREKKAAEEIRDKLLAYAQDQLRVAEEYKADKDYLDALKIYEKLAGEFRRSSLDKFKEIGQKAYKAEKKLSSDSKVKKEMKAAKYYAKAQKAESMGKFRYFVAAYKTYRAIVKRYGGTKAAAKAKERMEALKRSGELNYNSRCFQCRVKKRACPKCKKK